MTGGGIGGNAQQPLFMVLAVSAMRSVEHLEAYWSLQRRHAEGEHRWLDLAHYATKADAESALDRVVDSAHADRRELRVEHVRRTRAT
jgi:hypothetical protein